MARCSICGTLIQPTDPGAECAECQQTYHQACWTELGGCATYGCEAAAPAEKPAPPLIVGTGWGDVKSCPACTSQIASSRLVCSCGAQFPYADPMSPTDYQGWLAGEAFIASSRRLLVVLFLLCVTGLLAPVCGPIAGYVARRRHARLAGASGGYLALGYGSAAIGLTYTITIVLLAIGL